MARVKKVKEVAKADELKIDGAVENQIQVLETEVLAKKDYVIACNSQFDSTVERILQIRTITEKIDETRKEMTRPLDESKKKIMGFFKKFLDTLDKANEILRKATLDYMVKSELAGNVDWTTEKVQLRTKWKAVIIDASKVPAEYMTPNISLLSEMATMTKGTLAIAGVKFEQDFSIAVGNVKKAGE